MLLVWLGVVLCKDRIQSVGVFRVEGGDPVFSQDSKRVFLWSVSKLWCFSLKCLYRGSCHVGWRARHLWCLNQILIPVVVWPM